MFWKQDGAVPWLLIGILALVALLHETTGLAEPAQRWLYDRAIGNAAPGESPDVALVLIDEASQARHGRAPWPRDLQARLLDRLGSASVVVLTDPFIGRESERALAELQHIHATVAADPVLARHPELPALLERSESSLDGDTRLTRSLEQHQRTLLSLGPLPPLNGPAAAPAGTAAPSGAPLSAPWPLPGLRDAAAGIGHADLGTDPDNVLRHHPVQRQIGVYRVSSLPLLAAGLHRGLTPIQVDAAVQDQPPRLGSRFLALDARHRVSPVWSRPPDTLAAVSALDVLGGHPVALQRLQGRIVIVGRDDAEIAASRVRLPDGRLVTPPEALARLTAALAGGQWVQQPGWMASVPWLLLAGVAAYLLRVVPRLTTASAAALTIVATVGLGVVTHLLLSQAHLWLPLTLPGGALLAGHGGLWLGDRWQHRRRRRHSPVLFDAPMVDTVISIDHAPDLPEPGASRVAPLSAPAPLTTTPDPGSDFVTTHPSLGALPSVPPSTLSPPLPLDATQPLRRETVAAALAAPPGAEPTQLGPFVLDREIARGAMGRIYLAHDSRDGQVVAVKTLALAREFEGYALQEARQRFRREALAASRLQHPDIVRVVRTGEDRQIAYIAMEHLSGHDLTPCLQRERLLPIATVVTIAARIATALAHAHAQGVIHRDIKPANVMIDLAHDQVKVTDFGIARVVGTSRTRTGLILGSPSYMSPEQLAGREVDGRSDLYSLGVMMFQMLTGELPLTGHTMAALIGAIAHTPAPDVRERRPEVPEALANVIGILLEKRPELRYRDGLELATDLRMIVPPRPRERTGPHLQPTSGSVHDYAAGASRRRPAAPEAPRPGAQSGR
jgi:serine/threonine-protein kinase